jgi:hypothetical protein
MTDQLNGVFAPDELEGHAVAFAERRQPVFDQEGPAEPWAFR